MRRREAKRALLEVVLLLIQHPIPYVTVVPLGLRLFRFFLVFFVVFGDDVQVHGMSLHHFQLGFTFRAVQNLAFFHFVFVEIDFDGAFRTANHSRTSWPNMAPSRKRIIYRGRVKGGPAQSMSKREFPEWPMVGVGGVVIEQNRALLVRRAREPALGEWTIPGGLLEVGETLAAGVERELREETGLIVRVGELIEALERIFSESGEIRCGPDAARVPSASQQE